MPEKVKWAPGRKVEFEKWMGEQLFHTLSDRQTLERDWARRIEQYHAPRRGSGDFPFPGASNEEMPLTAQHAETALADIIQSVHAPRNLWSAVDLSGEFTDNVGAVTEYLTILDRLFLKMRHVNRRVLPDKVLLGTGVYYHRWNFLRKKVKKYDEETGDIVKETVTVNHPQVQHVPLSDFLWPANAWSVDADDPVAPAQWVGHKFELTAAQLRARSKGQEPFLPNYDPEAVKFVVERETEEEDTVEGKIREMDNYEPFIDRKIPLYRVETRYDVDRDGIEEDIIVIFYNKAPKVLRAVHMPWFHGKRQYEVAQYIQMFSMLGKGIADMLEMPQAVLSKMVNAQVDNILLANTRMFGVPRGMGVQPDEPIYPGKIWPLGPDEDIQEVRMGEVYPSIFQFIEQIQEIAELRTSINELRTGNVTGLPSRTPATTVQSLLAEGNKKFNMIRSNLRTGALATVGKRVLQMVAQRHQAGDRKWGQLALDMLGPKDGNKVIEVLDLPVAAIDEGLGIEVTTTDSKLNKTTEKQELLGLSQFAAQAYAQFVQAAQLIDQVGPQSAMGQVAIATYNGGREIFSRLLEAFDIQNPDQYLPPQIPGAQQQQQQAAPNGAAGGGGLPLAPIPTDEQSRLLQRLAGLSR